jgi:hypothetical protein
MKRSNDEVFSGKSMSKKVPSRVNDEVLLRTGLKPKKSLAESPKAPPAPVQSQEDLPHRTSHLVKKREKKPTDEDD